MHLYFSFLASLSFHSSAFPFFLGEDRDPDGYDSHSLPVISGADVFQETKTNQLEDAQGISLPPFFTPNFLTPFKTTVTFPS